VADYTPGYSFSGFQASSPAAPLPAPKLDAELGAIAAKLLDLRAMIKAIPIVTVVQQPTTTPSSGGTPGAGNSDGAVIISATQPTPPAGQAILWVQTGLGDDGTDFSFEVLGTVTATSGAGGDVVISPTQPTPAAGQKVLWIQTGLGDDGTDFSFTILQG
jgi:hypothetical protein